MAAHARVDWLEDIVDQGSPSAAQRRAAASRLLAVADGEPLDPQEAADVFAGYASASVADGLNLQLEVLGLRRATGADVGGWKISSAGSAPDARAFGFILASRVLRSGAAIDAASIRGCAVEPELALTIGRRLAGGIGADEARSAVTGVAAAFEICSFRLPAGPGIARSVRVGDGMSNWGLLLGEAHGPDVDLSAVSARVERDGELIGVSGPRPDLHDAAFEALALAVGLLGERGEAIEAGQHVILGSMLPAIPVDGAAGFTADFGALGRLELGTRTV